MDEFRTRLFRLYKLRSAPEPSRNEPRGYQFWKNERKPIELSPDSEDYASRLNDLVYDVAERLEQLRALEPRRGVFLATSSPSLSHERDELRSCRRAQNIKFFPEAPLDRRSAPDAYAADVDKALSYCEHSIHLWPVSRQPDALEPGTQAQVVIEYQRARRRVESGLMAASAWSPPQPTTEPAAPMPQPLADLIARPLSGFDNLLYESMAALHQQILVRLRDP